MQELTPDLLLGQNEQILLYGEPGVGKTELALTAPGPIYYLCIGPENELKTRYSKHFLTRANGKHKDKKIYFDSVRETRGKRGEFTDNPTGLDEAGDKLDLALGKFESGEVEKPETIVIDNATVLEEYQMNKAMVAGYETAENKDKTALKKMRDYGIIKPGDGDYGGAQSLMSKWMSWIMGLDYNLIVIAHEYKEYVQKKGTREREIVGIYPLFVGQQRISIARSFDNVWQLSISGAGRGQLFHTRTTGSDIYVAKTRVGGIFNEIETNLDLSECIEKFKNYPKTLMK